MPTRSDRFEWLEWPNREFPLSAAGHAGPSALQWLLVLAMTAAGFLALVLPIPWPTGVVAQFAPSVLMVALPLLGVHWVAPGQWRSLFRAVGWREVRWMVLFAILNIAVSLCVGLWVERFTAVQPNGVFALLDDASVADTLLFFARSAPQLLGEELVTVLPFLALMALLSRAFGVQRKGAMVVAWFASALLFGLLHLPTYGWNIVQCVAIIGTARLVLTLPWIMTKNLWVSAGAHILNDWTLFLFALAVGKAAG